jgi:hypothetical protein
MLELSGGERLHSGAWPAAARAWDAGIARFSPADFYHVVGAYGALAEVTCNGGG